MVFQSSSLILNIFSCLRLVIPRFGFILVDLFCSRVHSSYLRVNSLCVRIYSFYSRDYSSISRSLDRLVSSFIRFVYIRAWPCNPAIRKSMLIYTPFIGLLILYVSKKSLNNTYYLAYYDQPFHFVLIVRDTGH